MSNYNDRLFEQAQENAAIAEHLRNGGQCWFPVLLSDLTTIALEAPREYSEYLGTEQECRQVLETAIALGYSVPAQPLQYYREVWTWGVMVECSDDAMCDIVDYALVVRKVA